MFASIQTIKPAPAISVLKALRLSWRMSNHDCNRAATLGSPLKGTYAACPKRSSPRIADGRFRKRVIRVCVEQAGLRRLVITPTNCDDGAVGSSEELKGGLVVSVFDKDNPDESAGP
jgi:hypothetical protein